MASTALQLVNKVRKKHRFGDVAAFSDVLTLSILDALNAATCTVLEDRTWWFQKRDDGLFNTVAFETIDPFDLIVSATGLWTVTPYATAWTNGSFIRRMVVTSDADYSNTSIKVLSSEDDGAGGMRGDLQSWPGAANVVNGIVDVMVSEFIMPATVREITSVRHQEQELKLRFVARDVDFYRAFPMDQLEVNDDPTMAVISSFGENTAEGFNGTYTNQVEGILLQLYPVPEGILQINYSYVYQQPELTAITDTISGVTPGVENIIVDLAYAYTMQSGVGTKGVEEGIEIEKLALVRMLRAHNAQDPNQMRRSRVDSLDYVVRSPMGPRWPGRDVETF